MREELQAFVGIADSEGLDTLIPIDKEWTFGHLDMRARFNSHRHPLIFRIFLMPKHAAMLKVLWDAGSYKKAHEYVKENASVIEVATPREPWAASNQERWDSIPYYSANEHKPKYNCPVETSQLSLDLGEPEDGDEG